MHIRHGCQDFSLILIKEMARPEVSSELAEIALRAEPSDSIYVQPRQQDVHSRQRRECPRDTSIAQDL